MATAQDVYNAIEAHHRATFYRPISEHLRSDESLILTFRGAQLYPHSWMEAEADKLGWYQSREVLGPNGRVQLFFETLTPTQVQPSVELYHLCWSKDAGAIQRNGITPTLVNTTWQNRAYPTARTFAAPSLAAVFSFLDSKFLKGAGGTNGHGLVPDADLAQFEVFTFKPASERYYPDWEMTGSFWTDALIDVGRLSPVTGWRTSYRSTATLAPPF